MIAHYHKIWTHGQTLTILDFSHAKLGGHVIVGGFVPYAPSHVYDLREWKK